MTVSKDLFLSILSMDAYNRGYGAGFSDEGPNDPDGLGGLGSRLGSAVVFRQDVSTNAQAAGFYALAYEIEAGEEIDGLSPGQTVISYRGTNADSLSNFLTDAWNGYFVGAGSPFNDQAYLAAEFYQSVTQTSQTDPRQGDVILTGHSLGGGLAALQSPTFCPKCPRIPHTGLGFRPGEIRRTPPVAGFPVDGPWRLNRKGKYADGTA